MPVNREKFYEIIEEVSLKSVALVAVSKMQSVDNIRELYNLGQRDFGENYVQELLEKQTVLPADIRWHFIGHLQRNKVKYIAPFVYLIHGVDTLPLLKEINKQAKKINRIIPCLLQIHIAQEETKFGMNEAELNVAIGLIRQTPQDFESIEIKGLMGMASFSDDLQKVRSEMKELKRLFENVKSFNIQHTPFTILSMGMSGDYQLAIEEGSTMVRIGSLLFGARQ